MKLKMLRGAREIGGTCVLLEAGGQRLVLDLGMPLSGRLSLPRIPGLYPNSGGPRVDGVLLSHAHQDHYALLGYADPELPVHLSAGARKLIAASDIFLPTKANLKTTVDVEDGCSFELGGARVTPFLMDHSGFGAYSYLIEADGKSLLYSGDFRGHGRKAALLPRLLRRLPRRLDALLLEGTTLGRPGARMETEGQLEERTVSLLEKRPGLAMAYASGQNIDRLVTLYRAAVRAHRLFVTDLYTSFILSCLEVASLPRPCREFPHLRVLYTKPLMRVFARHGLSSYFARFRPFELDPAELRRAPGRYLTMLRGSLIQDLEPAADVRGGQILYSMWEGYRKEPSFMPVAAFAARHDLPIESVHTSGHAGFDDLKRLAEAVEPKALIPIHTEQPGRYPELWPAVRVVDDGEEVAL